MPKSPLSNEELADLLKHYAQEYQNYELPGGGVVDSRLVPPSWLLMEIAQRLTT